ncbi:MAG: hypothetical protein KF745_14215 [Phycisphaeraceae bacterium]|nr:hypothetical protein [Phycisphaeraceae bacterium]
MALKGINSFEQHVEKIFVAVIGAAVLGIVAWQFVGPKNTVKVGPKDLSYDLAYPEIERKAREVQGKMQQTEVNPPAVPAVEQFAAFTTKYRAPVAVQPRLAWGGDVRGARIEDAPTTGIGEGQSVALTIPAPASPVAMVYMATISPGEATEAPELKKYLPAELPYDKAGVSVEATFSGVALRKALEADPDGPGPAKPIPAFWWTGDSTQILGIRLERSERRVDGTWSDPVVVPAMPGRLDILAEIAKEPVNPNLLRDMVKLATESSTQVRRPQYYSIMFGEDWTPPTEAGKDAKAGNQQEITTEKRKLADVDGAIARLKEQATKASEQSKKAIEKSLARYEADRQKIVERLAELGEPVEGATAAAVAEKPEVVDGPLLQAESVRVWSHDVTAERGKTYRYRVILALSNPIYGHGAGLKPEEEEKAKNPIALSTPSPWTAPVKIPDDSYYFITSAQDGGNARQLGGARAAAELYKFFGGYWRKGTISLEPGDAIAGTVRVPDLDRLLATISEPGDPNIAPQAERPSGGRLAGGGTARGPAASPPAGGAAGGDKSEPIRFKEVPVSRDAFLLDVAAIPAEGRNTTGVQFQAYIRDRNGNISVRVPDTDRSSPEYQAISHSAAKGEEVVRPKEEKKPVVPQTRPGEQPNPAGGGGRGGGKSTGGG